MHRPRSFFTLLWIAVYSMGMPLEEDEDEDEDDIGCESDLDSWPTTTPVHVQDTPSAAVLASYQEMPSPHPSPSQIPHATLPVRARSQTQTILGATFGIVFALVALFLAARHFHRRRRRRPCGDPFSDTPKPGLTSFRFRSRADKKRLSDESWVSPVLPSLGSPVSPFSCDFVLDYGTSQRKLVPVTTPECTPTDTEFASRTEEPFTGASVVPVPPVRVPSPVYISPFSPSPSLSSNSSSLSPTSSVERLTSPTPNPARLSRLLSSTFRKTRTIESPTRPSTAHLILSTRSYPHAYRPSSTSLYTPPTLSGRVSGSSFYSGPTERDSFSTVSTSDTVTDTDTVCTVPHLLRAVAEDQLTISPFADPGTRSAPVGTLMGLKVRLSDASEHARFRLRETERQRQRERERASVETSETVLCEISWY